MTYPAEEWKSVPGFDACFEASSLGGVRRVKTRYGNPTSKRLTPSINGDGYYTVWVAGQNRSVHSLVASAFLGSRPAEHQVNHIDADKSNNRLSNLEYVTSYGNFLHAVRLGRRRLALSDQDVYDILHLATTMFQASIARKYVVHPSTISKIVTGNERAHSKAAIKARIPQPDHPTAV